MDEEDQITVKMSLRQWRTVATHVEGGIYREVSGILMEIYMQVNGQIQAANDRKLAQLVAEEIKAVHKAPASNADDPTESQSEGVALH